jgi:L,D-transpeptidase ErfK/SrfK
MKQKWNIDRGGKLIMARITWLVLMLLLAAVPAAGAPPSPPPLYQQVAGGEEIHVVKAKETLNRIALEKGLKWTALARRNGLKKPYKLKPGMELKLDTTHIVPVEVKNGLVINLPELCLYHCVNGVYMRRYALAVGKRTWETPTGNFKVVEKKRKPTWLVPESIQEEMEEQGLEVIERVPPGPDNPLGDYWMGTSATGVGIHATNRPWSVGHFISHGCIRMLPEEIAQLFPQVQVGTPVKIIYRPIKVALTPEGRIYLEANPNIYSKELNALEYVKELAQYYRLTDRIDWDKVPPILKAGEGIAQDITRDPRGPEAPPAPAPRGASSPREVRLSPLHGKEAKVE